MLTDSDLRHFTGTEQYHRHGLVRTVVYTDGVKYLAEQAGAFWLLDKIATLQLLPKVRAEDFQVWRLIVKDGAATLTCDDGGKIGCGGSEPIILHTEQIAFTDFPLDKIEIWSRAT